MTNEENYMKASDNIFEDLGFDTLESKELHFRSTLMLTLNRYIQEEKLTQQKAATLFKVTQPRISNLISGKVDLFSTSMLLSMLERAGFKVYENFENVLKKAA